MTLLSAKPSAFAGFFQRLRKTLLLVGMPLLAESTAYLCRPDTFPGYLNLLDKVTTLGLSFLYMSITFFFLSAVLALVLPLVRMVHEFFLPSGWLILFLTLTLERLLPHDSGFSVLRILVLILSIACGIGLYLSMLRKQPSLPRLTIATTLYCAAAAWLLGYLFRFPIPNVLFALILHITMFLMLLYLPGKIVAPVAVFLLIFTIPSRGKVQGFAPTSKLEAYERVVLIGIDGFSPDIAFDLANQGELPAIAEMMKNGTYGRLHTLDVSFSPLIWNSIYTGSKPQQHGVMAFTFTGVAGTSPFLSLWLDNWTNSDWFHKVVAVVKKSHAIQTMTPVLSRNRLRPAIWNMVNQNGASTIVAGGWTTYPPEKVDGVYISDYGLTAGKHVTGSYYPQLKRLEDLLKMQPQVSDWPQELQHYIMKDEKAHRIAMDYYLQPQDRQRFLFAYYSSTDAFGHNFGTFIQRRSIPENVRSKHLQLLKRTYQKIDRRVQEFIEAQDDQTLLIICSDHGFYMDKRVHNYPIDGVLFIYGKGVRKNIQLHSSIYAIAPTVLYALQLPQSKNFEELPLKQAFEGIIQEPPAKVYTRATEFVEIKTDQDFEREKMQELRDLQYLQ